MEKRKEHQYFSFSLLLRVFLIYLHLLIEMLHKYIHAHDPPYAHGHVHAHFKCHRTQINDNLCARSTASLSFLYSTHIQYFRHPAVESSRERYEGGGVAGQIK